MVDHVDITMARERDAQVLHVEKRPLLACIDETVGARELALAQFGESLGQGTASARGTRVSGTPLGTERFTAVSTVGIACVSSGVAATSSSCVDSSVFAASAVILRARGDTIASVIPSDRMLRHSTVSMMRMPGKNVAHHAPLISRLRPAAITFPQDGSGSGTPACRNDSEASKTMASATSTVAKTRTGAIALRATWRTMMRGVPEPITRTAET